MENRFISRFLFNEICLLNRHSFATPKDASQDRIYSFVNEVYLCLTTMIPFQRCERCYNCVARVGEGNRECKWMARKNKTDPTKCAIILLRTFSFFFLLLAFSRGFQKSGVGDLHECPEIIWTITVAMKSINYLVTISMIFISLFLFCVWQ